MPYQSRRSGRSGANSNLVQFNTRRSGNNYKSEGTGIRRHNQNFNLASGATAIASGSRLDINGVVFTRSFDGSVDTEPTPTASNNFGSSQVMNGSNIGNFQTTIKIQNEGAQPHFLNIYQTSLSFADCIYADSVYGTSFPYVMTTTGVNAGQVLPKTPDTVFTDTVWRNFMGLQRHIRKIGTINIGTHDAGDRGVAELNFIGIPPKNRKSQTGNYYGWILSNDTVLNSAAAFNGTITQQSNFDERPSSNRLPYQW